MSSNTDISVNRYKVHPLSLISFIFAGLSLIIAILTLIYGFSFRHGIQASTLFIQNALGLIASQIIELLINGIQTVILTFSSILFLASILLYCAGRNTSKSYILMERMSQLETSLAEYESVLGGKFYETVA